jgi:hypothetical protein
VKHGPNAAEWPVIPSADALAELPQRGLGPIREAAELSLSPSPYALSPLSND